MDTHALQGADARIPAYGTIQTVIILSSVASFVFVAFLGRECVLSIDFAIEEGRTQILSRPLTVRKT